jgi:virginiamycin A acetyltransferase
MSILSKILEKLKLRYLTRNEYENVELRKWFADSFGVEVGLYSYGCFDRWRFPPRTRIGRYCSFAKSVRVLDANHPMDALTTHPYLYDPAHGVVDENPLDPPWLNIEDDVWVSHNATIAPSCKRVGRGAVIAAGAVVTKDVPPYAIVAGVPAAVVRYRFDQETQAAIEQSRWWELDKAALRALVKRAPDTVSKPTAAKLAETLAAPR